MAAGAAVTLAEVDRLRRTLDRYHLFHATRAVLLRDLGREMEAASADQCALALTTNLAERALIEQRLAGASSDDPARFSSCVHDSDRPEGIMYL